MNPGKHALQADRPGVVAWLTPARRKAVYTVVASVLTALVAFDVLTPEHATAWTQVTEQVLAVAALILAAVHTGGVYEGPTYGVKPGGGDADAAVDQ